MPLTLCLALTIGLLTLYLALTIGPLTVFFAPLLTALAFFPTLPLVVFCSLLISFHAALQCLDVHVSSLAAYRTLTSPHRGTPSQDHVVRTRP